MSDRPGVDSSGGAAGELRTPHAIYRPDEWAYYMQDSTNPFVEQHENGTPSLFSEPRFMAHPDGTIEDRDPLKDCE